MINSSSIFSKPMRRLFSILGVVAIFFVAFPLFADGYRDTPIIPRTTWNVHDPDRPKPVVVTPGATFSQMAPPPSDATVLFDGRDLSNWTNSEGGAAHWKVLDGYCESVRDTGMICTRTALRISNSISSSPLLKKSRVPVRAAATATQCRVAFQPSAANKGKPWQF